MQDTLTRFLNGIPSVSERTALRLCLTPLFDRYSTMSLNTAGLVIKAGGGVLVKTGAAAYYGIATGILVTKAAATDMAALVGSVTNAKFNTYSFFIDSAGTLTSQMGTEAATLGAVVMAPPPAGKAQLGFIIVNPTGTGPFVGGTTALDDATVVPNVVYINTIGPFDPSVLI